MKKAFTLIELLVVIGIIGILVGVFVAGFGGSTESAKNAHCLTNMKNLANACHAYGMSSGHYPLAGSVERLSIGEKKLGSKISKSYNDLPGWISWNSANAYAGGASSHMSSSGWLTSTYSQDETAREYSYTNGVLWKYVNSSKSVYTCPAHVNKFKGTPPAWSYVMNSFFGWSNGDKPRDSAYQGRGFGSMKRADRRLLFAEIPFMEDMQNVKTSASAGTECDCVLQYKSNDGGEVIGFNHSSGKKSKFAHVVFADGHTEKISWPNDGMDESMQRKLTEWLCEATDFSFDGKTYQEVK